MLCYGSECAQGMTNTHRYSRYPLYWVRVHYSCKWTMTANLHRQLQHVCRVLTTRLAAAHLRSDSSLLHLFFLSSRLLDLLWAIWPRGQRVLRPFPAVFSHICVHSSKNRLLSTVSPSLSSSSPSSSSSFSPLPLSPAPFQPHLHYVTQGDSLSMKHAAHNKTAVDPWKVGLCCLTCYSHL